MKNSIIKITVAIGLVFLPVQFANADAFEIDGKSIEIPDPEGLFRVQDGMEEFQLFEVIEENVSKTDNKLLALYYLENGLREWGGHCQVQINKKVTEHDMSHEDFSDVKKHVMQINSDNVADINEQAKFIGVSIMQLFPPHHETDTVISTSSYLSDNGIQLSVTNSTVNASGKLLLLYCHALREKLHWTQDTVRVWGNAIVAGNPPPPTKPERVKTNLSASVGAAAGKGFITGVTLGILIVLGYALRAVYRFIKKNIRNEPRKEI